MVKTSKSENCSSVMVDLEQVLIHFINESDRSASVLVVGIIIIVIVIIIIIASILILLS